MILRPLHPKEAYKAAWVGYAMQHDILLDALHEWYLYFASTTGYYLLQFRVRWCPSPVLILDRQHQGQYLRGKPLIFSVSEPADGDLRTADSAQATRIIEGVPNLCYIQCVIGKAFPNIDFIWGQI